VVISQAADPNDGLTIDRSSMSCTAVPLRCPFGDVADELVGGKFHAVRGRVAERAGPERDGRSTRVHRLGRPSLTS
jgi:hypothetical protein